MINPILAQKLGQYFRQMRKSKGITQKELKDKLGFSAQFLGHIESGKAMIPEEAFVKIITELKLDPNEIQRIYMEASSIYVEKIFRDAYSKNASELEPKDSPRLDMNSI